MLAALGSRVSHCEELRANEKMEIPYKSAESGPNSALKYTESLKKVIKWLPAYRTAIALLLWSSGPYK